MKNTQLRKLFSAMDSSEFREFGKFVRSPFFNNRSEVIRFYDCIKKSYPEFDEKNTHEEKIYRHVYGGKKFSSVMLRKLYSLTSNLIMEFFAISGFRENELDYNIKLVDKLREKKLPDIFEKKAKQTEDMLEKSLRGFRYYEARYKYASILNGHYLNVNEKTMVNRFQNEIDYFVEYFLAVSMLIYIRLGEWSRGFNINFDLKFNEEVINYIAAHRTGDVSLATLYYNMLMLMNTEDEKYFYELLEERDKFESKLTSMDDYNIGIVTIQYCYKRVLKGDTKYRRHQFDITNNILKKDLLPPGYVDQFFFTNTVRNASSLNENKWSEDFVRQYRSRLNPVLAEEIVEYSYSMIEFGKGNYESSLRHLSKINLESSNMKVDIKNLLIIIYYELDYKEELLLQIDSYKHFIQRDRSVSEQLKERSLLFLKFVSGLVKIYHKRDHKSAYLLMKEIGNTPYFNAKEWLLKKAEELCKKK